MALLLDGGDKSSPTLNRAAGQLTRYPVGSIRELWILSYPLMLSLFSVGLMIFCDRLFLASQSIELFNGVSEGAMFFMAFEFSIVTLAAVSEVLVGRYYGSRVFSLVARPVWAMIWMSLATVLIFYPAAIWGADLLFFGSPYKHIAKDFFCTLCFFGPILPFNAALSAFWIGRGRVVFITFAVGISSLLNVGLDYFLIFGSEFTPPLGVVGAALSTGISQVVLGIFLFSAFLFPKYRKIYQTNDCRFVWGIFREAISIGFPQSLAMLVQCLAWAVFSRVMSLASEEHAFIYSIAQALFFFFNFVIEGVSKACCAITSNLIGARRVGEVGAVVSAGVKLLGLFAAILFFTILLSPKWFLAWFMPVGVVYSVETLSDLSSSLFWIWFTLMGESLLFLFGAVLLAFRDSRYILVVSSLCIWFFGIAPATAATLYFHQGPDVGLAVASFYYVVAGICYFIRIRRHLAIPVVSQTIAID